MPVNEIIQFRKHANEDRNLEMEVVIHCAPLIKGIKLANLMTISDREQERIPFLLEGTGISYFFFPISKSKRFLYLYRAKWVCGYLNSMQISDFLKEHGYQIPSLMAGGDPEEQMKSYLRILSQRVIMYHNRGKDSFPHEIGVFLGYPLSDVKGFLEDDGDGCICTGYWKVYGFEESKKNLFRRYNETREIAVREILDGRTLKEIAV